MTTNGNCLLDTNIVIGLFAADRAVLASLSAADAVFVPSIVLGELFYGAQKSGRPQANIDRVSAFATENTILVCDEDTALEYSLIKNNLRTRGKPLPENDIWIGALARQHNLTLITRDRHFAEIEDVPQETW